MEKKLRIFKLYNPKKRKLGYLDPFSRYLKKSEISIFRFSAVTFLFIILEENFMGTFEMVYNFTQITFTNFFYKVNSLQDTRGNFCFSYGRWKKWIRYQVPFFILFTMI